MDPEDIGKAYDQITHLWERGDFNQKNGIPQHQRALQFFNTVMAKNKDAKATRRQTKGLALDVGCGCNGRIRDLLLDDGLSVEGIDISTEMINKARKRHPQLTFHQQDICTWELPQTYDFITAWDSLWHIPLAQQKPVLQKLFNALNPSGICIFSAGGTDEPGDHTDDFMGPEMYYSSLGVNGFLDAITEAGCVYRHFEYDQYPELHVYFVVEKGKNENES